MRISLHVTTELATYAKPVQRSPPRVSIWEDTSSERILKNKELVPFPSHQLRPTAYNNPSHTGATCQEGGWYSLPWLNACLCTETPRLFCGPCVRLEHRSLADAAFNIRARQQSLSERGNGLHYRAWWCWHVSLPIDQMDTTHCNKVWVILKNLHPNRQPGQGLRDAPVIHQWRIGAEDYPWLPRSCNAHIQ